MTLVIISGGKIKGRPIIKAWESFSGWYWFATEKTREQLSDFGDGKPVQDTIWYGFVIGTCPEWGYFSEKEIRSLAPLTWEIRQRDIPFISKEVRT
jgi:hypothetical protein